MDGAQVARAADRLAASLEARLNALGDRLTDKLARAQGLPTSAREALELASYYPMYAAAKVRSIREDGGEGTEDLEEALDLLRAQASALVDTEEFIETWLLSGELEAPRSSTYRAIEAACLLLGIQDVAPVVTCGELANHRINVGRLADILFSAAGDSDVPLGDRERKRLRELLGRRYVFFSAPNFEGRRALWRPIMAGHEVGHYALHFDALEVEYSTSGLGHLEAEVLPQEFLRRGDENRFEVDRQQVDHTLRSWVQELICDYIAVRLWGVAGAAALTDFFVTCGAVAKHGTEEHPPTAGRLSVLWEHLDSNEMPDYGLRGEFSPQFETHAPSETYGRWMALFEQAVAVFRSEVEPQLAEQLGNLPRLDWDSHARLLEAALVRLRAGIPPDVDEVGPEAELAALTAGWIMQRELPGVEPLVLKSLEGIDLRIRWDNAGQEADDESGALEEPGEPQDDREVDAVAQLSGREIRERLEETRDLIVLPRLGRTLTADGLDLRLGTDFIVFQNSGIGSYRMSTDGSTDPRALQQRVYKDFGTSFVLHPGELVLAATLEFIALPSTLAGQVLTRSSLGRLGLVTATATGVNPGFKGCLTLELVNHGQVPLELPAGIRIASLALFYVDGRHEGATGSHKYQSPTGPEFSKIDEDPDLERLRVLAHGRRHAARDR